MTKDTRHPDLIALEQKFEKKIQELACRLNGHDHSIRYLHSEADMHRPFGPCNDGDEMLGFSTDEMSDLMGDWAGDSGCQCDSCTARYADENTEPCRSCGEKQEPPVDYKLFQFMRVQFADVFEGVTLASTPEILIKMVASQHEALKKNVDELENKCAELRRYNGG